MHNRWLFQLLLVTAQAPTPNQAEKLLQKSITNAREGGAGTAGRLYIEEYTALDKFEHRSDCFKRVSIQGLRGRCDRLEMDETARVRAAVSLAICELKAASTHDELVPMECAAFASEERAEAPDDIDPRACTQAMLRSTQAWASFSGYHRDILPICAAMQHANGIDRALELFHNATVGNIALIRYFEKRTEEDQISRESWYELHRGFRQTTEDLRLIQSRFNETSRVIVDEASELLHTAFISGEALIAHMQTGWEKRQEDSLAVYGSELKRVQDTFAGEVVLRSHELAAALDPFSVRFSSLSNDLESQQHLVGASNQALNAILTSMQAIRQTAGDLSVDLSDNLAVSINVRKEQDSALRGTVQLAQSVQLLTYTVDETTKNFEETLMEAIERLPSSIARSVVSLGNGVMTARFCEIGWLSLAGIVRWLANFVWEHPVEAALVYLIVYRCIPRVVALVWWFVTPLLGPACFLLHFVRCLRSLFSTPPCAETSRPTAPITPMVRTPASLPTFNPGRFSPGYSELPSFTPTNRSLLLLPSSPARSRRAFPELWDDQPLETPLRKLRAQSAPVDTARAVHAVSKQTYTPIIHARDLRQSNMGTPQLTPISEYLHS